MAVSVFTPTFRPLLGVSKAIVDQLKAGVYLFYSDKVNYNDSTPATIFRIPAGCIVVQASCEILTVFAGTSPVLSLGVSGTTARHMATTDITTTTAGWYSTVKGFNYAATADLIVTIGGTSLTQGIARFWIGLRFFDENFQMVP